MRNWLWSVCVSTWLKGSIIVFRWSKVRRIRWIRLLLLRRGARYEGSNVCCCWNKVLRRLCISWFESRYRQCRLECWRRKLLWRLLLSRCSVIDHYHCRRHDGSGLSRRLGEVRQNLCSLRLGGKIFFANWAIASELLLLLQLLILALVASLVCPRVVLASMISSASLSWRSAVATVSTSTVTASLILTPMAAVAVNVRVVVVMTSMAIVVEITSLKVDCCQTLLKCSSSFPDACLCKCLDNWNQNICI